MRFAVDESDQQLVLLRRYTKSSIFIFNGIVRVWVVALSTSGGTGTRSEMGLDQLELFAPVLMASFSKYFFRRGSSEKQADLRVVRDKGISELSFSRLPLLCLFNW
jgi:hypothetical protein